MEEVQFFPIFQHSIVMSISSLQSEKVRRNMREIPVLLYHNIGKYPEKMMEDGILPDTFDEQMKFFSESGYRVVSLQDAVHHLRRVNKLPPKSLAITIDGGYQDAFDNVFPILKKYSIRATFFIPPETVGGKRAIKGEMVECMGWGEIRKLVNNGMEIGLLAYNGRSIRNGYYDDRAIRESVLSALEILKEEIDYEVQFCAFKEGVPQQPLWDFLRQKGIQAVFTQCPTNQKAWIDGIGRIQIDDDDQNIFFTKISKTYLFFKDKRSWKYLRKYKVDRVAHHVSEMWNRVKDKDG